MPRMEPRPAQIQAVQVNDLRIAAIFNASIRAGPLGSVRAGSVSNQCRDRAKGIIPIVTRIRFIKRREQR